tara:strand:- start:62 stop:277 length:216 start_codon:yes stop_codon:yes gene_type:complete
MKTFKQFMENIAPKMFERSPKGLEGIRRIRDDDVIKQGVDSFRDQINKSGGSFDLPIPLVKKKTKTKRKTT